MARSLEIKHKQQTDTIKTNGGSIFTSIILPCEGTYNADTGILEPYEITVLVDGQNNNASFTIETFGSWYTYKVERLEDIEDDTKSYVKILLTTDKNIDTLSRLGEIVIKHNSSPLSIYVDISQEPTVYSIKVEYVTDGIFKSFPKTNENYNLYEDKEVIVTATGGSKKWYIKNIEQYEAYDTFKGEGTKAKNGLDITTEDRENEIQQPYDGVFAYFIDGDKLTVRSFGQIDLSETHMRYYFKICHKDVNNLNKRNNIDGNGDIVPYETSQLFIFKREEGEGYGEEGGQGIDKVDDEDTYLFTFLVNGKKSHSIDISKEGGNIPITITSKRNGEVWSNYTYEGDGAEWCKVTESNLKIETNDGFEERHSNITYIQKDENGEIIDTIIVTIIQLHKKEEWVLTVNGNEKSFDYEELTKEGGSVTLNVVSTKNGKTVAYSSTPQDSWLKCADNSGVVTFDKNDNGVRYAAVTFKQLDGSPLKPISVLFKQKGVEIPIPEKQYRYEVRYCDTDGEKLMPSYYSVGTEGSVITCNAISISGYSVSGSSTSSLKINKDENKNVVIFTYIKNADTVKYTVNYRQ